MDERDLALVSAAFDRLLANCGRYGCDPEYRQTIFFAKVDVLEILAGKWSEDELTEGGDVADAAEDWTGEVAW